VIESCECEFRVPHGSRKAKYKSKYSASQEERVLDGWLAGHRDREVKQRVLARKESRGRKDAVPMSGYQSDGNGKRKTSRRKLSLEESLMSSR
jgi:hypothetical protein